MQNVTAKFILNISQKRSLSEVVDLNLSKMNITEVPYSVFNKLINLRHLDLSQNRINVIEKLHLPRLKTLNLTKNNLSKIPDINCHGKIIIH